MADNELTPAAPPPQPLYAQLPPAIRQLGLLVGVAAAVAAGFALVLWSQSPNFTPLYTGLNDRDVGEVVALIESTDVPYKLDPTSGGVLVPADRKYEIRMQMASAGLPRGTGFGVEQMPELGSFGQTPFMENALYTHAVETELGRTIGSMQSVEGARVHLAVPPRSAFLRQQREPSASVMLSLYPGRRLDQSQVQSVVYLVASAIPQLSPQRVTVVDQSGSLLTRNNDDTGAAMTSSQFEYTKQLEDAYARRIESLLSSVVGSERVRASVAAVLDFTVNEETRESFDPNAAVVRSEQTSEETRTGDGIAQGVPGALSNQPPETAGQQPPAAAAAAPGAAAEPPQSTMVSQVRNYEIDKTISHTRQALGTIQRLSIGVLIDHRPSDGGDPEPLPQEELDSLTALAQQAVGFDAARGDTISVMNSLFQAPPEVGEIEAVPIWQQPFVWSIARQVFGAALVLVLAFVIVRPMIRTLTTPLPALPSPGQFGPGPMAGGYGMPRGPALPVGYDDRLAAARNVAGQDPRQVAQVVRNWVAEDNG
jgi:flagellar M-ring protein FliF